MKKNMKWAALALSLLVGHGGQFLSAQSLELVSDKGATLDYNPHAYYDIDRDGKLEIIKTAIMRNGRLVTSADRLSVATVNLQASNGQLWDLKYENLMGLPKSYYSYQGWIGSYLLHPQSNGCTMAVMDGSVATFSPEGNLTFDPCLCDTISRDPAKKKGFVTDANQDGLPDVYFIDESISYGLRGGGYANTQMHFTSDTSKVYNYTKATGDSNFSFPSVKDGMFVGLNEPTNHMIDAYDMSRTGAKDFFSEQGELAYNIGDNNYYTVKAPGRFTPCDINNDGETDFVVSKKGQVELWIYREGGTYEAKQLVANEALSKSYCRDFDHDGDADILVAFDYKYGSPNTFLVFFRNNGDDTFRKKENAFEAQYEFGECVDAFNDGNYQIIANTSVNTFLINLNADFTACESFKMEEAPNSVSSDSFLGDIDRDGNNEILVDGRLLYRAVGANPNTAPQKMSSPSAIIRNGRQVNISWAAGHDNETSAIDLTYELRIGSTPGADDILCCAATTDGTRRNLLDGNMGRNRNFLWNVSDLPAGDYYIAIQAVDGGRKGGGWSDETVYRHYAETVDFIASHSQLSTADTLVVRCAAKGEVTWNCDGGRLISNEAGEVRMMWQTPGTKSLSYSLRTTGGQLVNSQVKRIEVSALGYENTGNDYGAFGIYAVDGMDIDGDGVSEIYNYGWWKNEGNDRFKKIALTYNTDLSKLTGIADINSDGFPDFISSYVDKGNVYLNYGEGDLDFDYATYDLGDLAGYSKYMWVDFDNNGALDAYYLPSMDDSGWMTQISRFLNPGNYQNFTKQDWMGTEYHELHTVCDVNRDGMPDIIATGRIGEDLNSYQYNLYIYYKKPGEGFDYEAPKMFFENYSQERGTCMLGDMNNDGYIDLIKQDDSKRNTLLIYEGGPTGGTGVVRELRLIGKEDDDFYHPYLFNLLRDYDNNGYIDIPLMSNDVEYVALMKPGYAYDIEEIDIYARDIFIPAYVKQDQPLIPSGNQKKSIRCGIRNERPAAPGELTVQQTADGILLSWQPGADKETPQCHLRYNVSVKKEGAKGEGAFIISPMNSMKENSTLPSGVWHSNVPQMFIPISCFEAGKNYEVQVQSIDLWEKTSPMTQPLTFMVMEQIQMRMPTDAVLQDEVKVERIGTGNTDAMFEWDGGSIVRQEGNTYYITWATPGVKTVTLTYGDKTYKSQIRIHEPEAIDFALPDNVLAGVPVVWPLPESVRRNPKDFILKASDDKVDVQMNVACDSAIVCFPETGTYQITLQCVAPYKTNTLTREVKVAASMPVPVLEGVGADGSLRWFPAELPEGVSRVEILKESNISGMYIPLDTVAASNLQYTDKDSRGHITPQTYIIRYLADNGQQSHTAEPHTTMHLMVCEAMNDGHHLIWTHYKGREVTNYTVKGMRNGIICMEEQVSGTNCSYTVFDSDNDISYYVTASFASDKPIGRTASRSVRADSEFASNSISVQQAVKAAVHPTDIQIRSIEQQAVLSEQQPVLHLYALLLPVSVSVNRVNWTIVSGEQYATINGNGVLSAKNAGSGTVVVKASTVDGSDLSAELIVKVDDWTGVEIAVADEPVFTIKQQRLDNTIRLSGWMQHEKAFVYVININGVAMNISSSSDGTYTLREDDYSAGTYVVVVQQGSRIASSKIFIR